MPDSDSENQSTRKTLDERAQMSDIERLRHSTAHVLATAIARLWPDAQFAAGPPVDNGFYYDVDLEHHISTDDFEAIEGEMRKIVKENQTFEKAVISRDEAMAMAQSGRLAALGERGTPSQFKIDLLGDIPEDEEISIYKNGDFWDLCAGPHVPRTGNCKAFKLMSVAAAFYKGDAANPQLQRVYGTAFKNKTMLGEYLEQLEEAKKRDHRKLGKELDLFHIDEAVGQGLVLWKPNGSVVRNELQNFISGHLERQGYSQVYTPHIGKLDLFQAPRGHFPVLPGLVSSRRSSSADHISDKLADRGLLVQRDLANSAQDRARSTAILLRPMNCPHAHQALRRVEPSQLP